jgi:hypothetical protein
MHTCPKCYVTAKESDDIAVHLLDHHGWGYEEARLWLRDTEEGNHPMIPCQCEECRWMDEEQERAS